MLLFSLRHSNNSPVLQVSNTDKGNFPAFISAMEGFPSVLGLQIPMKRPNCQACLFTSFFSLHHSVSCSTLCACSITHQAQLFAVCKPTGSLGQLCHLRYPERVVLPLNLYFTDGVAYWYFRLDLPCFPLLNSLLLHLLSPRLFHLFSCLSLILPMPCSHL